MFSGVVPSHTRGYSTTSKKIVIGGYNRKPQNTLNILSTKHNNGTLKSKPSSKRPSKPKPKRPTQPQQSSKRPGGRKKKTVQHVNKSKQNNTRKVVTTRTYQNPYNTTHISPRVNVSKQVKNIKKISPKHYKTPAINTKIANGKKTGIYLFLHHIQYNYILYLY